MSTHTIRLHERRQSGVAVGSRHRTMAHGLPLLLACVLRESSNIFYFGFNFFENREAKSEFFRFSDSSIYDQQYIKFSKSLQTQFSVV